MVIFKQKDFSSLGTKALYGVKQTANKVSSAVKRTPSKSRTAVMRDTIKLRDGIVKATYYPGEVINKGVELVAKNPAAAVTYVATAPLPVPSTIISGAVNKVANKIPSYGHATQKLGNAWNKSKASERIKKVTTEDISKFTRSIPLLN